MQTHKLICTLTPQNNPVFSTCIRIIPFKWITVSDHIEEEVRGVDGTDLKGLSHHRSRYYHTIITSVTLIIL